MRSIIISLDENDKITLETLDFMGDLEELFHVLATSTKYVARLIEDGEEHLGLVKDTSIN